MKTALSVVIGVVVALFGVAMVDVDPTFWRVNESAKIGIQRDKLFNYVTDAAKIPDVRPLRLSRQ